MELAPAALALTETIEFFVDGYMLAAASSTAGADCPPYSPILLRASKICSIRAFVTVWEYRTYVCTAGTGPSGHEWQPRPVQLRFAGRRAAVAYI